MFSPRSFFPGVLRFPGLHLCLKLFVFFRQRIASSRHCFEFVSQLAVLFLKFRHLGLQLLVLLQGFCVFAGSQRQTQHDCYSKSRPSIFAYHTSPSFDENLNCNWTTDSGLGGKKTAGTAPSVMEFSRSRKPDKPSETSTRFWR